MCVGGGVWMVKKKKEFLREQALLYYHGRGGKVQDGIAAVFCMSTAAEYGDGESQLWMSRACEHKFEGLDEKDAVMWCERAIASGNTEALVHRALLHLLHYCLIKGDGAYIPDEKKEDTARKWIEEAKSRGEVSVHWFLSRFVSDVRDKTTLLQKAIHDENDETLYVFYQHLRHSQKWLRYAVPRMHIDELRAVTDEKQKKKIVERHQWVKEQTEKYADYCEQEAYQILKRMETSTCLLWIGERAACYAEAGRNERAIPLWKEMRRRSSDVVSHIPCVLFETCVIKARWALSILYEDPPTSLSYQVGTRCQIIERLISSAMVWRMR